MPLLLFLGGRRFDLSSSFRQLCAAVGAPASYFRYDWRREGAWDPSLMAGIALGGFVGGVALADPEPLQVAAATVRDLGALGVAADGGLAPATPWVSPSCNAGR